MPRIVALHRDRMAHAVLDAARAGDVPRLRRLLAPAVTVTAGIRHLDGRDAVIAWLLEALGPTSSTLARVQPVEGRNGIVVRRDGVNTATLSLDSNWRLTAIRVSGEPPAPLG